MDYEAKHKKSIQKAKKHRCEGKGGQKRITGGICLPNLDENFGMLTDGNIHKKNI